MRTKIGRLLLLFCLTATLVGCAEGGFSSWGAANPWVRKRWAEEERQYGPILQTRVDELRDLRSQAPRLNEEEVERASRNLAGLLQQEKNILLRIEATRTLGALPSPTAAVALRKAQADPEPQVRIAACQAWGMRRDQEGMQALAAILGSDTDESVRIAAARGLSGYRDKTAFRALGTALEDREHPALQYQAVASLKQSSGRDYGDDLTAWRRFAQGEDPGVKQGVRWAGWWKGWF